MPTACPPDGRRPQAAEMGRCCLGRGAPPPAPPEPGTMPGPASAREVRELPERVPLVGRALITPFQRSECTLPCPPYHLHVAQGERRITGFVRSNRAIRVLLPPHQHGERALDQPQP